MMSPLKMANYDVAKENWPIKMSPLIIGYSIWHRQNLANYDVTIENWPITSQNRVFLIGVLIVLSQSLHFSKF